MEAFWNSTFGKYQCESCHQLFEYKYLYFRHVNRKIPCNTPHNRKCDVCNKSFLNKANLKRHTRSQAHLNNLQ